MGARSLAWLSVCGFTERLDTVIAIRQHARSHEERPPPRRPAQLLQGREVERAADRIYLPASFADAIGVEDLPILFKEVKNDEDNGYRAN